MIRQSKGRITLTAAFPEVTLELALPTQAAESEVLVMPMSALDEIGSTSVELAELESTGGLKGMARWPERVRTRTYQLDLVLPGKQHDSLPKPQEMKSQPARLLEALHEAGRTCSRDDGRFALSRVQVKGARGEVIATDGKVAVLFTGFDFPFTEDLLVPAVPLFGCPELRGETNVRAGRTKAHLVVGAGDWTAWLAIASVGKYPDVAAVIPRHAPTTVKMDRGEAAKLLPQLLQLPGQAHELRPVTLEAGNILTVAGYDEATRERKDVPLPGSSVSGPTDNAVLDRRALARILALGCNTLGLTPGKALVGAGEGVKVLVAPLDPQLAAPMGDSVMPTAAPVKAADPIPNTTPERSNPMKPPDTNGSTHRREPPRDEPLDPLIAAEELRDALGEVLARATRLIAALKATRKEKKVLSMASSQCPLRNG